MSEGHTSTPLPVALPVGSRQVHDWLLVAATVLIGLDTALSLAYWSLETNPVVLALGPAGMVAVKSIGATIVTAVWFAFDLARFPVSRVCAWLLFALHLVVVVTNLQVVIG